MKTVYLAHPIGGDVEGNVAKVEKLVHHLLRAAPAVVPIVPYLTWLQLLDENVPGDRELGLSKNRPFFQRRFLDELWICGDRSDGVRLEMAWAEENGIPIKDMTDWAGAVIRGDLWLGELTVLGVKPSRHGRLPFRKVI